MKSEKGSIKIILISAIVVILIAICLIVFMIMNNKKAQENVQNSQNTTNSEKSENDLSKYELIGGNEEAERLAKAFDGDIELIGDGTAYGGSNQYDYRINNINIKTNKYFDKGTPVEIQIQNVTRVDNIQGDIKSVNASIEAYYEVDYRGSVQASGFVNDKDNINFPNNMVYLFSKFEEDFSGYAIITFSVNGVQESKKVLVNALDGDIAIWKLYGTGNNSNGEISLESIKIYFIEDSVKEKYARNICLPIDNIYYNRLSNYRTFKFDSECSDFSMKHGTRVFHTKDKVGGYDNKAYARCVAIVEIDGTFYCSQDTLEIYNENYDKNRSELSEFIKNESVSCGKLFNDPSKIQALYLYED